MEEFDVMREINNKSDKQSEMIQYFLDIENKTKAIVDIFYHCLVLTPESIKENISLLEKIDIDQECLSFRGDLRLGMLEQLLLDELGIDKK